MMKQTDLAREILECRGIKTVKDHDKFLSPEYGHLHDPLKLPDMNRAVKRLSSAIESKENIVIYGDYDIDGLSATALLLDAITAAGGSVSAYIPDRFEEGYGINTKALEGLYSDGASLVITVDCGSTSHQPLERASELGLDVIVTDHHETGEQLPPAVAVINPKRADSRYPFNDLAGVGVAFKLAQAMVAQGLLPEGREKWLLDLVALGTVCDVVKLVDENRVLVTYGLKVFSKTPRVGLRALMAVSGLEKDSLDTYAFGFVLGPRLNAAGRLEHARLALELFTTEDKAEALAVARKLDELNAERRRQQQLITDAALEQAEKYKRDPVLVLSHPDWSHGIVGIVAAKLVERLHKPVLILQELEDEAKGSARSLGEFNMVEALTSADALLNRYGGHKVAAGCSLDKDKINGLRRQLNDFHRSKGYVNRPPRREAEVTLPDLSRLTWESLEQLERLAPFGMGNPRPLLRLPKVAIRDKKLVGEDQRHVKLRLDDGDRLVDAIAFGLSESFESLDSYADIVFELDNNRFMGQSTLQAKVVVAEPCQI